MTVTQKQCLLKFLGYYTGAVDGLWGANSKKATTSFQNDFGLTPDGVCGPETEKALKHSVAYGIDKKPENKPTASGWDKIKYFKKAEFKCQCGGKYCNGYPAEIDLNMVAIADKIRERIGKPINVNSGVRCSRHNANVGGVSNSQHLDGNAADLGRPSGFTAKQMAAIAEEIMGNTGGIGIYSWGIHIDTRKTKSRWNE